MASSGDQPAFEEIVKRYTPLMLKQTGRILREDCEDAVQQALVSAWDALRAGHEVRELRPWLCVIARRAALQILRGQQQAIELSPTVPGGVSPSEQHEGSSRAQAMLSALAGLPAAEHDALLATSVHGRSNRDMAIELGLSEGATRQLVFRARRRVRAASFALLPLGSLKRLAHFLNAGARRVAGGVGQGTLAASAPSSGALVKLGAVVAAGLLAATPVIVERSRPRARSHPASAGAAAGSGTSSARAATAPRPTARAGAGRGARAVPGSGQAAASPPAQPSVSEQDGVSAAGGGGASASADVAADRANSGSSTEERSAQPRGSGGRQQPAASHSRPPSTDKVPRVESPLPVPAVPAPVNAAGEQVAQGVQETLGKAGETAGKAGEAAGQTVHEALTVPGEVGKAVSPVLNGVSEALPKPPALSH